MDANVTYRKTLWVSFSDLVDEDDYKLRIVVSDRDGDEVFANFPIKIDVERHDLKIVDALFTPSSVQAGQALLGVIRVENFGEQDEEDVKVMVSIPALGVGAADYIEEIDSDDEEETEELFIKVPKCAEAGAYDAQIVVEYNNGFSRIAAQKKVNVLEDPACKPVQDVTVEMPPPASNDTVQAVPRGSDKIRSALEIILLVLVALLVVIGLIIGFSKMGSQE
jgi:uncharacterized membrane protein